MNFPFAGQRGAEVVATKWRRRVNSTHINIFFWLVSFLFLFFFIMCCPKTSKPVGQIYDATSSRFFLFLLEV